MICRTQKRELISEEELERESVKNGINATSIPSWMSCITRIPFSMFDTSDSGSESEAQIINNDMDKDVTEGRGGGGDINM